MNEALLSRFRGTKTPRTIYVRAMDPADETELTARGYTIVDLDNVEDRGEWCLGATQASLDGTISLDKQQTEALELEMRSRGLLDVRRIQITAKLKAGQSAAELLSWGDSRHTLQGNTLLVNPKAVKAHAASDKQRKPMAQRKARGGLRKTK